MFKTNRTEVSQAPTLRRPCTTTIPPYVEPPPLVMPDIDNTLPGVHLKNNFSSELYLQLAAIHEERATGGTWESHRHDWTKTFEYLSLALRSRR